MDLDSVIEKPKLAILISGHMRSFRLTSPSFLLLCESLKEKYDCKTFIHTWDTLESSTPTWYEQSSKVERTDPEEINRIYLPTKLVVEKQPECSNEIVFHNQSKDGLYYSEYSKFRANELKKEFGKFDYALCIRPDIHFYSYDLPGIGDKSRVWLGSVCHNNAAFDVVCYSSSDNIDRLREYESHYRDYILRYSHYNYLLNNETLMLKFMEDRKINFGFSQFRMPTHWKIVRSWWPSVDHYESDRKTWDRSYYG